MASVLGLLGNELKGYEILSSYMNWYAWIAFIHTFKSILKQETRGEIL